MAEEVRTFQNASISITWSWDRKVRELYLGPDLTVGFSFSTLFLSFSPSSPLSLLTFSSPSKANSFFYFTIIVFSFLSFFCSTFWRTDGSWSYSQRSLRTKNVFNTWDCVWIGWLTVCENHYKWIHRKEVESMNLFSQEDSGKDNRKDRFRAEDHLRDSQRHLLDRKPSHNQLKM